MISIHNQYFISPTLFSTILLVCLLNVNRQNETESFDNKRIRNAYRLKWLAVPEIIASIFILILRFTIPQMNGLLISLVIVPVSQLFPIFSDLIAIYMKYGKKGVLELKFFK